MYKNDGKTTEIGVESAFMEDAEFHFDIQHCRHANLISRMVKTPVASNRGRDGREAFLLTF